MDAKLSKVFYHTVFYLTDDDKINYNRYQAIRYLKPELREQYYDQAILVSNAFRWNHENHDDKKIRKQFHCFQNLFKQSD